jgi:hypothetical protein
VSGAAADLRLRLELVVGELDEHRPVRRVGVRIAALDPGRALSCNVGASCESWPNTTHLWNRVHDTFHVRVAPDGSEYGLDAVDPLMWRETRHLLTGDSHARALGLLDEFLTSNGERLIRDPLKRAVFQNDLWARPSSRRCG